MPHAADMELWMRLTANADVGFIRCVDQAYYRLHAENMRKAYGVLGTCASGDWSMRRCSTAEVRGCQTQLPCQGWCTASWAARRSGLPDVHTTRGRMRQTELARRLLGAGATGGGAGRRRTRGFRPRCWPEVSRLPLYRTLESHKAIGPRALGCMFAEKVQWWLRRRSWRCRGI
jgi:hypothetical protein